MRRASPGGRVPSKSPRPGAASSPRPSLPRKRGRETAKDLRKQLAVRLDAAINIFRSAARKLRRRRCTRGDNEVPCASAPFDLFCV
jgi:hypothetical protein